MSAAAAVVTVALLITHAPPSTVSPGSSAQASVDPRPADLDDFSKNAAYRQFFQQSVQWASSLCPSYVKDGECAVVKVPRDWNHPQAGTARIGLRRLVGSMNPKPERLLLTHGGGPGGSQLLFSSRVTTALGLGSGHVAIGVDTRGSGLATGLTCPSAPKAPKDPTRASTLELTEYFRRLTAQAQACTSPPASVYEFASTDQAVRDLNLVRQVLGYPVADFFGTSYGAWVGTVARQMFPRRFERVVLDSAVDWTVQVRSQSIEAQIQGYHDVINAGFAVWAARHDDRLRLGKTPGAVMSSLMTARNRISSGTWAPLTVRQFDAVVCAAMLNTSRWQVLAEALAQTLTGSPTSSWRTPLTWVGSAAGSNPHLLRAVLCNDTGSWGSASTWAGRIHQLLQERPLVASRQLPLACTDWPRPAALTPQLRARPVGEVLILQHEYDPATPWAPVAATLQRARHAAGPNADATAADEPATGASGSPASPDASRSAWADGTAEGGGQRRPAGTLAAGSRAVVVRGGFGHGVLGNPCAREATRGYLQNGYLPGADIDCRAAPLPWESEPRS